MMTSGETKTISDIADEMKKVKEKDKKSEVMKYYYKLLVLLDTDSSFAMRKAALKKDIESSKQSFDCLCEIVQYMKVFSESTNKQSVDKVIGTISDVIQDEKSNTAFNNTVRILRSQDKTEEKKILLKVDELLKPENTKKRVLFLKVSNIADDDRIELLSNISKIVAGGNGKKIESLKKVVELLNDKSKADALMEMVTMLDELKIQVEFSETDQAKDKENKTTEADQAKDTENKTTETDQAKDTENKTTETDQAEATEKKTIVFDKRYQVNLTLSFGKVVENKTQDGQTKE